MEVQHREEEGKGIFFIYQNGETVAELTYSIPTKGKLIIQHTGVDESLEGKGLGKQLVGAAVEHARSKQIQVIPVCSFAKSVIDQEPEWQAVLLAR